MPENHPRPKMSEAQYLINARTLIGKRLNALLHDQYYFNDEKDLEDTGSLTWQFGDGEVLAMYILSDGARVGADLTPGEIPPSFGIGPNAMCSWRREELLADLSATHLEGTVICSVEGILDAFINSEPWLAGFRVTFETGDYLAYFNQGDNAAVMINAPPPTCAEIQTRFVTSFE